MCLKQVKILLVFILNVIVLKFAKCDNNGIIVTTKNGDVEGIYSESAVSKGYYRFTGIPYAEPPIGEYRFMEAAPKKNWTKTWKATKNAPDCVQIIDLLIEGSEDCLYLNIFTPQLANSDKTNLKPVMFFIYGGYFLQGGLQPYDNPELLLQHDVVVVTINYRLNIFGFLSSGTEHVPGNTGLKDQILALRWIKDNIAAFGGDPDAITIFGESAGAASVHYLVISPLTKGLFRYAISESGSVLASWATYLNPKDNFIKIADYLKLSKTNFSSVVEKLQSLDYKEVLSIYEKTMEDVLKLDNFPYAPCIEPASAKAVISKSPYEIIRNGDFNPVPYITGVNSCEGKLFKPLFLTEKSRKDYIQNVYNLLPKTWIETLNETVLKQTEPELKEFYFPNDDVIPLDALVDSFSDTSFFYPFVTTALLQNKLSPIFTYVFTFTHNLENLYDLCGVPHGGELPFIWYPISQIDNQTSLISKQITTFFTNFAKFGNPTPKQDPILEDIIWNKVQDNSIENIENIEYLNLTNPLNLDYGPFKRRTEFWSHLWKKYCYPDPVCSYYSS